MRREYIVLAAFGIVIVGVILVSRDWIEGEEPEKTPLCICPTPPVARPNQEGYADPARRERTEQILRESIKSL